MEDGDDFEAFDSYSLLVASVLDQATGTSKWEFLSAFYVMYPDVSSRRVGRPGKDNRSC